MRVRTEALGGAAILLGCGAALAATAPPGPAAELLLKAEARVLDARHAGPFTLQYALRFSDGTAGTYVWRRRDADNCREEIKVGERTAERGVLSGKGWRTPGDEAPEAWWLESSLFAFRDQLAPETGQALAAENRTIGGREFVEVRRRREPERGSWVVFLTSPELDLSLSEIGFVRRSYSDWKTLRGAGMVPGICRIYIEGRLALEMTLERGTNQPIAAADLARPADAVDREHCPLEVSPPKLVIRTPPTFPAEARAARVQGLVVLSATITAGGEVRDVRPVYPPDAGTGPRLLLVNAAEAAVKTWRYEPARCQGTPIATDLNVTVSFALN